MLNHYQMPYYWTLYGQTDKSLSDWKDSMEELVPNGFKPEMMLIILGRVEMKIRTF